MALQVRRGTNAERLAITPLEGELIYVTDTKQLYVGDGTTLGGTTTIQNTIDSLLADSTPQLGGSLDLNGNDITGTGNINITGTITATGNINLGDGAGGDQISVGGVINGDLVPDQDGQHDLGSASAFWKEAWLEQLTVDSQITAERVNADIIADDSTVVFNSTTGLIAAAQVSGTFTGNVIGNVTGDVVGNTTGYHTGDVSGSVFAGDSSVMVDAIGNELFATNLTLTGDATIVDLNTNSITDRDTFGILEIDMTNTGGNPQPRIELKSNGASGTGMWIMTEDTSRTLAGTDNIGRILFRAVDAAGTHTPAVAIARKDELIIAVGSKNTAETFHMATATGNYGLGIEPSADAKVNVGGAMLLGNMDTTTRDGLTAANGMIIYNTTDNKFQGYENGSWVNLI
jgi:hypothetical protein